jgi:hypothetical protein
MQLAQKEGQAVTALVHLRLGDGGAQWLIDRIDDRSIDITITSVAPKKIVVPAALRR